MEVDSEAVHDGDLVGVLRPHNISRDLLPWLVGQGGRDSAVEVHVDGVLAPGLQLLPHVVVSTAGLQTEAVATHVDTRLLGVTPDTLWREGRVMSRNLILLPTNWDTSQQRKLKLGPELAQRILLIHQSSEGLTVQADGGHL